MRPKLPTPFPRTLPKQTGPEAKSAPNDKLEVTNTDGAIDQTVSTMDFSVHEFDFMTYSGLGKGMCGDTCEVVDLFIQGLRS